MTTLRKKIKLESIFLFGLIVSLFPWISFGLNKMGMQPYFIISFIITLLFFYHKYPTVKIRHSILALPLFFIIFQFFNGTPLDALFIRDLISYIAFSISCIFFYEYLLLYGFPKRVFEIALLIWILAALPQLLFGKKIYFFLVFSQGTEDRGLPSLASEPSFFGLHTAVICSLLVLFGERKKTYRYIFLGLIAMVLSGSIVSIIFHALFMTVSLILTKQFSARLILISIFIFSLLLFFILKEGSRLMILLQIIWDQGLLTLLTSDVSAKGRIADMMSPYILSYYNLFSPMGRVISELNDLGSLCYGVSTDSLISCSYISNDNKIGSYIGNFIFHYGVFIFPVILYFILTQIRDFRTLVAIIFLVMALIPTIPLGYPLVAFYLSSYFFFIQRNYKTN